MLTIPTTVQRLSRSLAEAEESADQSILKAINVMSEVVTSRMAFRDHEATVHAQPALMRMHKATSNFISAQGEILHAHGELKKALHVTSGPAEGDCPDWVQPMGSVDEHERAAS